MLRKGWTVLLLLLLGLGVGACQRFSQETPASPTATSTEAAPTATAAAMATATSEPLAVSNRIFYVGNDFAIYTVNPDGTDRQMLTEGRALYTWPTLSRDGTRVAFSSFSPDPLGPGKALYSVGPSGNGQALLFEDATGIGPAIGLRIPHYSIWSPDGQYLAFLAGGESGIALYVVSGSGQAEPRLITEGAPLYLSWSHDSESLLLHHRDELLRVDIDAMGRLLSLEADSSAYRAPAWSPTSDLTAFLVSENGGETLYVARPDGSRRRALAQIQGLGSFLWSPQGDKLAIGQSFSDDRYLQDIQVVDVESGVIQSLVQRFALAFFWSPDGSKLAYVTNNENETALQWRVIEVETGRDREIVDFHPTSDHLTWLTYFDQYAPSHQVWSPDSRWLVFAGALPRDFVESQGEGPTSQVYVLDTEGIASPEAIATGVMASWSTR